MIDIGFTHRGGIKVLNLKMHQLLLSINHVCEEAIKDGVPPYAVGLILEKIKNQNIDEEVSKAIKTEYQNTENVAVPNASGPVTKDL